VVSRFIDSFTQLCNYIYKNRLIIVTKYFNNIVIFISEPTSLNIDDVISEDSDDNMFTEQKGWCKAQLHLIICLMYCRHQFLHYPTISGASVLITTPIISLCPYTYQSHICQSLQFQQSFQYYAPIIR